MTVPSSANPNQTIAVSGTGWRGPLDISFDSTPVLTNQQFHQIVKPDGSFSVQFKIPATISLGTHTFHIGGYIDNPNDGVTYDIPAQIVASKPTTGGGGKCGGDKDDCKPNDQEQPLSQLSCASKALDLTPTGVVSAAELAAIKGAISLIKNSVKTIQLVHLGLPAFTDEQVAENDRCVAQIAKWHEEFIALEQQHHVPQEIDKFETNIAVPVFTTILDTLKSIGAFYVNFIAQHFGIKG